MLPSHTRKRVLLFCIFVLAVIPPAWPQKRPSKRQSAEQKTSEQKTARYFESLRNQPLLLHSFVAQMPKGADLHNHLSGAVYAESFIQWAVEDGLCIDRNAMSLAQPPCDPAAGKAPATAALQDPVLYGRLLDSFSMRQFLPGEESGHDHFFATFGKFGAATNDRTAEMLAEVRARAAEGHLQYMELMFNPDGGAAGRLGVQLGWNDDLARMREQLLAGGLLKIVAEASRFLDETEQKENAGLHCGQPQASPGCGVQARYLYQVSRGLARENVFAQILAGFEMASRDPRVVGLNLVMAEDWYVPIRDFNLHMQMLDFLHGLYPKVHITLHAGELTQNLVPPEELFHIRASVEKGHAERIGHGVDVMQEADPERLLRMMAQKKVLVEVCLTSNDVILNVTGAQHPLPMYLRFGVPVALATDDPGVSRGDITHEFERAAETYHLGYLDLKKFARASLEHSFLPGASLWKEAGTKEIGSKAGTKEVGAKEAGTNDAAAYVRTTACSTDNPAAAKTSARCSQLLESSEKAREEWALEKAFTQFESRF
jgi:adenosine deaminase